MLLAELLTGPQWAVPSPDRSANTGCAANCRSSCERHVSGLPLSAHKCSCQRRFATPMPVGLPCVPGTDEDGLGFSGAELRSAT